MKYKNQSLGLIAPPPDDSRLQTRTAVLDAAERLFSEGGVDGVSVRDITAAAGANLGAVNYHFGSKDRLVMEVFARRLQPINHERIARLDALEKAAGGGPVELSRIVEAFVRPGLEIPLNAPNHDEAVVRLINRCLAEPNLALKKFVEEQFTEMAPRFDAAILRTVAGLSQEELFWRMIFFVGALHQSQDVWMRFDQFPRPGANAAVTRPSQEEFIRFIIAFVTAGMREPSRIKLNRAARRPTAPPVPQKTTSSKP
jgi:AcrR family transcriptional regulator